MKPTPTTFPILLGIYAILFGAHAEESSEITLHNNDALAAESAVENWTLICEQLCSLNLSGPPCGLECASAAIPVSDQNVSLEDKDREDYNFTSEHQSELCETLCDNGLGEQRCKCLVKILPAAFVPQRSNRNKICSDFCFFHRVTIRGCSRCPYENLQEVPLRVGLSASTAASTVNKVHNIRGFNFIPPAYLSSVASSSVQAPTTNAPSTPDWNLLCTSLCRQGSGGILCNCDLAPF